MNPSTNYHSSLSQAQTSVSQLIKFIDMINFFETEALNRCSPSAWTALFVDIRPMTFNLV